MINFNLTWHKTILGKGKTVTSSLKSKPKCFHFKKILNRMVKKAETCVEASTSIIDWRFLNNGTWSKATLGVKFFQIIQRKNSSFFSKLETKKGFGVCFDVYVRNKLRIVLIKIYSSKLYILHKAHKVQNNNKDTNHSYKGDDCCFGICHKIVTLYCISTICFNEQWSWCYLHVLYQWI